jgi:HAD superfamily hydrolase (TIGR01549 family)
MLYIFDFDQTLVDSSIYFEIYNEIITYLGLKYGQLVNIKDSLDLCRHYNEEEFYYNILKKRLTEEYIFPYTRDILNKYTNFAVATNSSQKTVKLFFDFYKLPKPKFIFTKDDALIYKKDVLFWKKMIEKFNLNPKECTVIGDNIRDDFEIPKKVGFNAILIDDFIKN